MLNVDPSRAPSPSRPAASTRDAVRRAVAEACDAIAPTWPLDRYIAVNPLWSLTDRPFADVAATLAARGGATLLPRAEHLRDAWRRGDFDLDDLRAVCARHGDASPEQLRAALELTDAPVRRRARFADVVDARRDLAHEPTWSAFVVNATSQFCAAYFDEGQASLAPDRRGGLYASWRRNALRDRAPRLLMGFDAYAQLVQALPDDAADMAEIALTALDVPPREAAAYLHALLLDQIGWASWCAHRRWSAPEDRSLEDLLGIRLAWEWLLRTAAPAHVALSWQHVVSTWAEVDRAAQSSQETPRRLLEAWERAYQRRTLPGLRAGLDAARPARPVAQVVCCIDVREEPLRRALEAQDDHLQTLGFAGFFGVPGEHLAPGADRAWPHLPGLLTPSVRIADTGADACGAIRQRHLDAARAKHELKRRPAAALAFVEALGVPHALRLLAAQLGVDDDDHPGRAGLDLGERRALRPRIVSAADGAPLTPDARVDLAERALRGMSLTRGFAPLVLLLGHGATTRNTPHEAGLHCGACGGQTGEVSARALAALLNEPAVREGLAARGVVIPAETCFLAGTHDTTTDDVTLYDRDDARGDAREALARLEPWLDAAAQRVREARAPGLGLGGVAPATLPARLRARAADWGELQPEWGLADNALFLAMPRERCRHLNLEGRAFLHEYRHDEDRGGDALATILTAPLIVAHWINLQYYASTVDPERYGSGNKTLHNVVGGHLGVFEGNGGDLRIGLPLQSVHDGARWRHRPLRLTAVIEARRGAVGEVIAREAKLRALVAHGWIHLFVLDPDDGALHHFDGGAWRAAEVGDAS
ncbi:MAG: DUF2309 domain-containing protein [Polyangiales bacterium]